MQREVLDYLYKQGGITLFAFHGREIPFDALINFALVHNAGARFVLFDFSKHLDSSTPISLKNLFERELSKENLEVLSQSEFSGLVFGSSLNLPQDDEAFRIFYHNILHLKKFGAHIIGILPDDDYGNAIQNVISISQTVVFAGTDSGTAAACIEDCTTIKNCYVLWFQPTKPNRVKYPKAFRIAKKSFSKAKEFSRINWEKNPQEFSKALKLLNKHQILKKNPLEGLSRNFRRFFLPILAIFVAAPFFVPTNVDIGQSNVRDRTIEKDKISMSPAFEYTFDGKETMQRISRYAIGRFNALITDEKIVERFVQETLDDNGYSKDSWKSSGFNTPPAGTIIKFSRPDYLDKSALDSIGPAWKYWTSILSDSIAYITEFYHQQATSKNRQHNGIDLAAKKGTRILAPFSAKAWTKQDERGGIIIGLVRKKDVILFMHCDQLLYLDGQEVMQGDPIATIGMTGNTTGPHVHIVTGIIDRNGPMQIGNVRYKVTDPMKWFLKNRLNDENTQ